MHTKHILTQIYRRPRDIEGRGREEGREIKEGEREAERKGWKK